MDFLFYFLLVIAAYMVYQNYVLLKRNKHNKGYVDLATGIFNDDPEVSQKIDQYIQNEDSEEFQNKARIFRMYEDFREGKDACETLNVFSADAWFLDRKNRFNTKLVQMNSDSFVWSVVLLNEAMACGHTEFLDGFLAKFDAYKDALSTTVEYSLVKNVVAYGKGDIETANRFFTSLNEGEYGELSYDKRLIGIYKRIGSFYLAESGAELPEYEREDMNPFSNSSIGKLLMKDRGVYDKYHIEEEAPEVDENSDEPQSIEEESTVDSVEDVEVQPLDEDSLPSAIQEEEPESGEEETKVLEPESLDEPEEDIIDVDVQPLTSTKEEEK